MSEIALSDLIHISDKEIENIKLSINADEDKFKNNLKLLKDWIHCQEYLPKNYDENVLSVFLYGNLNNLEKAKNKFQKFYVLKKKKPEIINLTIRFTTSPKILENIGFVPLPKLTKEGQRVYIVFITNPDINLFDADLFITTMFTLRYLLLCKEQFITGDILILDGSQFGARHCAKALTPLVLKIFVLLQTTYPVKLNEIHFININSHIEKLVLFVKKFLNEKVRKRIIVHKQNENKFLDYFPLEILPEEYGGKEESKLALLDKWNKYILQNKDWLKYQHEEVNCKGDIPTDIIKLDIDDDLAFVQGSFRQLNID